MATRRWRATQASQATTDAFVAFKTLLFALPARITTCARVMHVKMLSLSERMREEFERYFLNICRC
jgi:hypothetical protein